MCEDWLFRGIFEADGPIFNNSLKNSILKDHPSQCLPAHRSRLICLPEMASV
jgi:hypothetical protein